MNIKYSNAGGYIYIESRFFNYEYGTTGEHGYLEWVNFAFSLDGLHFDKLLRCEVKDQVKMKTSWILMKDRLKDANIQFIGSSFPESGTVWFDEMKSIWIEYKNYYSRSDFYIKCFVPSHLKIKYILVTGKWHVNGLRCSDEIDGEIYDLSDEENLNSDEKIDLNQKYIIDKFENNAVKVTPYANAVIINGAAHGLTIRVYATSGTLLRSMVADADVMNIKLPANQMYFVEVGLSRYKVAL